MRYFVALLIWACLMCGARADPVATATVGEVSATLTKTANPLVMLTIDWASSTTGACTATVGDVYGEIQRVTIKPDAGATAPTDSYDVTLQDADGFDVLIGHGANVSSTTVASFASMVEETTSSGCMPVPVMGSLTLAITNAGDQNGGIIRLYLKP